MTTNPRPIINRRVWVDGVLELSLSDGSFVRVGYDTEYNARLLSIASDEFEDYRDCTVEEVPLHPDEIEALVNEVYRAKVREADEEAAEYLDAYCPDDEGAC